MMPLTDTITRYWINLTSEIGLQPLGGAVHANLLEMRDLRELIQDILTGTTDSLPDGITTTQPADINPKKKLLFTLHGHVQATLQNDSGQSTILNADGSTVPGIPDVEAGQFGDSEYLLAPLGSLYHLILDGASQELIDLDIQQTQAGAVLTSETFEDVPTQGEVDVTSDGTTTQATIASTTGDSSAPPVALPAAPGGSGKTITVSHTKGIANSKSVLKTGVNAKPVKAKAPKSVATTTKKASAKPKAKPLTKKAKATISALLDELTAELEGLLTKLPH
jgi:hypothetical protein